MHANTTAIVLPRSVTFRTAEDTFRMSKRIAGQHDPQRARPPRLDLVRAALRAARDKNPRLLKALEDTLEVLQKAYEDQLGEWQRQGSRSHAEKPKPELLTFYEHAYVLATDGVEGEYIDAALQPYGYLVAAVAVFADVIHWN